LALIAALLLAACGGTAQPAPSGPSASASVSASAAAPSSASGPIKFSYPQPTSGFMPLWLAQDSGLFAKYGLDTEMLNLPAPTDLQALQSGEVQFALEGGAAVAAIAGGSDLTFIAALANHYAQQLYVTSPDIQSTRDLIGKSIGATAPGASSDGALRSILKHEGIAPSQVNIVYLRDDHSIFGALQAGTIQAAILTKATIPLAKQLGYRLLVDANELKLPTINVGIVVRRDWAQQNPEAVLAFLKGVMEGIKLGKEDPAAAKAEIQKYSRLDDPAQIEQVYADSLDWAPYPLVQDAGLQTLLDLSTDEKVKAHKPGDFYDNSYLLKLQDWVKGLYPEGVPN
jgi:ABC-type nitrate/sulfonate/bicarbonate transport system substrate-binding protein